MRKLFRSMLTVAAMAGTITLAGCSDLTSGPGGGPDISGTWTLRTIEGEALPSPTTGITGMTAAFTAGGDYTIDTRYAAGTPEHETGVYTFDGTTLALTAAGQTQPTRLPATLSGATLTVDIGGLAFAFRQ
ncbi:MAG TPA: lipocalin family protein [Gemmatimonadales bacterium]|nr:lipocalin family protein [Gemmatimonadales bacterium]